VTASPPTDVARRSVEGIPRTHGREDVVDMGGRERESERELVVNMERHWAEGK
jgi:hypothetical protein